MGFTIQTYQLLGLPPLPNIYVSIHGGYKVEKNIAPNMTGYTITFTVYYKASKESPVITQSLLCFNIQALPSPANLYIEIYQYIKGQLAQSAGGADPNQQLVFIDG